MSFFDQTIRQFLSDASSSSPTPGGGSVAALVAALGSSMAFMVANVSTKTRPNLRGETPSTSDEGFGKLIADMERSLDRFETLLADDIESFTAYMSALNMPKADASERIARQKALQSAIIVATETPVRLAQECFDVLEEACQCIESASKSVLSDLGIAIMLLNAAAESALLTARGNITSIKDERMRDDFKVECDRLEKQMGVLRSEGLNAVQTRMFL